MIFVDSAAGSRDLYPLLQKAGMRVELAKLDYADVEFVGKGVKGEPVTIGCELKRIAELTSDWDRFAGHQLPKMLTHYDHRWLVFEGEWVRNREGALVKKTGWSSRNAGKLQGQSDASALRKKLLTVEMCGGFHVQHINGRSPGGKWSPETVRFFVDLYRWWTDDDFDQHKSHIVNYQPHGLVPLTKYQQAFAAWPRLSTVRAKAVAKQFKNSIRLASHASVDEWAEIEVPDEQGKTRRIGQQTAQKIVNFLKGEDS